jgi:hypothetical protein
MKDPPNEGAEMTRNDEWRMTNLKIPLPLDVARLPVYGTAPTPFGGWTLSVGR